MTNEWLQWYTCKAAFEADGWKVRTATHCNLTNMERYRSGHNEAVLKTVCPQGRVGSNPTLSVDIARSQIDTVQFFSDKDIVRNDQILQYVY